MIKSRARTRVPLNLVLELGKENNELDFNFESMLFTCDYSQYLVMLNTFAYSKEQLGGCSLIPSSVVPSSSETGSHTAQAGLELTT